MLAKIRLIYALIYHFGPQWAIFRFGYVLQQRSSLIKRRVPLMTWNAQPLSLFFNDANLADLDQYLPYRRQDRHLFFFNPTQFSAYQSILRQWDTGEINPLDLAAELEQGHLRYFGHTQAQVGFPPYWHKNPFTAQIAPTDKHWSQLSDFEFGDIKIIWEPSRFGFVYTLVRAYARTGDEKYAEWFWQLVESWREYNPPQHGVNWKCGQEISFRVMAWCFGLYAFLDSPATNARRVADLAQMIATSGQRIAANIQYALNQRNNHGISEGLGLWTIGTLFPEFRQAKVWQRRGREILENQGRMLIYEDGAFAQHSVNYHRLMLHDYLWCLRLGDIIEQPFSDTLRQRVARAGHFLYQLQVGQAGEVPYYGQNDGALILPLNNCDYRDFRPVIQAIHYLSTGNPCYEAGSWDEDRLWLFGPDSLQSPIIRPAQVDLQAESGGYYSLRSQTSCAFIRCASFRDRPAQADMLHMDLWWQGFNIALDAGTYSYNAPEPWDNALAETKYHNTAGVDDLDQMTRVSKFLWLPWLKSQVQTHLSSQTNRITYWQGRHNGYERLSSPIHHQRAIVRLGSDTWLILDNLFGKQLRQTQHSYRLHWLLADWPYLWDEDLGHVILHTLKGDYHAQLGVMDGQPIYSFVRAGDGPPRGWQAPYYFHREPALSLDVIVHKSEAMFWTLFGPESYQVHLNKIGDELKIQINANQWQAILRILPDNDLIVQSVTTSGSIADKLDTI